MCTTRVINIDGHKKKTHNIIARARQSGVCAMRRNINERKTKVL